MGHYPDPLGIGKTPSRFSDPRPLAPEDRYGVLYLGESVKVCFLEAVLRDQRDGVVGDLPIEEKELRERCYVVIETTATLNLVDLREDGPVIMGVPSDVAKATSQSLARQWSLAFHEHPQQPDGVIYPSRLNGHTNLAIYDRAIAKLKAAGVMKLITAPGLAAVLDELCVCIV